LIKTNEDLVEKHHGVTTVKTKPLDSMRNKYSYVEQENKIALKLPIKSRGNSFAEFPKNLDFFIVRKETEKQRSNWIVLSKLKWKEFKKSPILWELQRTVATGL